VWPHVMHRSFVRFRAICSTVKFSGKSCLRRLRARLRQASLQKRRGRPGPPEGRGPPQQAQDLSGPRGFVTRTFMPNGRASIQNPGGFDLTCGRCALVSFRSTLLSMKQLGRKTGGKWEPQLIVVEEAAPPIWIGEALRHCGRAPKDLGRRGPGGL